MYTETAATRRRCTGTTKTGAPYRGWACWGDPRQRCKTHGGTGGAQRPLLLAGAAGADLRDRTGDTAAEVATARAGRGRDLRAALRRIHVICG